MINITLRSAVLGIAVLFGQVAAARACFLGIGCDPTVNGNVNAQIGIDLKGLDNTLDKIDGHAATLLQQASDSLSGETQQVARDLSNETTQISASIRQQIQQLTTASSDVVNQVGDRLDVQLQALRQQADDTLNRVATLVSKTQDAIHRNVLADVAVAQRGMKEQLTQIHDNVDSTLNLIGGFLNESANQFYARSQDVAQRAHQQAMLAVDRTIFVVARGFLVLVLLIAAWRVTRQVSAYVNGGMVGTPIEPVAGGALVALCIVLLASKQTLLAALGLPARAPDPVDICTSAETRFQTYNEHRSQGRPAEALRIEAGVVEEELSHCSYSTLSRERSADAKRRIGEVARTLVTPPLTTTAYLREPAQKR